jgi:hypothetical protein
MMIATLSRWGNALEMMEQGENRTTFPDTMDFLMSELSCD